MPGCKLTQNLGNKNCEYAVAGLVLTYLANFYPPVVSAVAVPGRIAYTVDADGYISDIILPTGESFYQLDGSAGTMSFTDALLAGGNGGKYRQHTLNAVINQHDIDILNEADALSLGRFIAVGVKPDGSNVLLGRTGGLAAPAGGFDYNSGAADADASGWTLILQGSSMEAAPLLLDGTVVTPIYVDVEPEP